MDAMWLVLCALPSWQVVAVFALAGFVKGVVGLGLPTVCMALLGLWMAPAQAAALLVVPSLLTNFWQMRPWPALPGLTCRLWPLLLGVVAGTVLGAVLWGAPAGAWASLALGLTLVSYGAWGLSGRVPSLPPRLAGRMGGAAGLATGMVTALTGVFVVPAVPYLQALGLGRDALVQAMGLAFTVSTVAMAAGLAANAALAADDMLASWLLLIPSLAGMTAGQRVRGRLSARAFRRCLFGGLLGLGAWMAVRALA